jgi:hypothetical protein
MHTFVPGVPKEIMASDRTKLATVQRRIPGFGEFVEVSSPILDGIAGSVHVGMDKGLSALKIQTAICRHIYLISMIFIVSIVGSFLLVNLAVSPRPAGQLRHTTRGAERAGDNHAGGSAALLERNDEVGQLARLVRHLSTRGASPGRLNDDGRGAPAESLDRGGHGHTAAALPGDGVCVELTSSRCWSSHTAGPTPTRRGPSAW